MRIISKRTLKDFYTKPNHKDAKEPLSAWYSDTMKATWNSPNDIKSVYRNASFVANNRVVFNIGGNKYRLVAAINYDFGIVFIKFVGTHRQYDRIDVATVGN